MSADLATREPSYMRREKTSMTITEFYADTPRAASHRSSLSDVDDAEETCSVDHCELEHVEPRTIDEQSEKPSRETTCSPNQVASPDTDDCHPHHSLSEARTPAERRYDQQHRQQLVRSFLNRSLLARNLNADTTDDESNKLEVSSSRATLNTGRYSQARRAQSNLNNHVTSPCVPTVTAPNCSPTPSLFSRPFMHVQTLALPLVDSRIYLDHLAFSQSKFPNRTSFQHGSRMSRIRAKNGLDNSQNLHLNLKVSVTPSPQDAAASRSKTTVFDGSRLPQPVSKSITARASSLRAGYSSRRLLSIVLQRQMDIEQQKFRNSDLTRSEISLQGTRVGTPRITDRSKQ